MTMNGIPRLLVTGFPSCLLFHNNRNGTFSDVTEQSGVKNSGKWGAGAAGFDYDRDGILDLIHLQLHQFSFSNRLRLLAFTWVRAYSSPKMMTASLPRSIGIKGDGTFAEVSVQSGVQQYAGRAFGVVSIMLMKMPGPSFCRPWTFTQSASINQKDGT